jgi:PTS system fructose-specific IIC component
VSGINDGDGSTTTLVNRLVHHAEELAPGVVLVHAETELARTPSVVFGVSKEGFPWSDGDRVHVVVSLLDPPGRDATRHLQNLAAVARMFHSAEVIKRVRVAEDERELRAFLSEQQRPNPPPADHADEVA